jgi:ligand-binding sensor domain-containing protein
MVLLSIFWVSCSTPTSSVSMYTFSNASGWTSYNRVNNDNRFREVFVSHNDTVWATTFGNEILQFDGSAWTTYPYGGPVAADQNGTIWVGLKEGLARFDGRKWQLHKGIESKYAVSAISISPDNTVWVALWGFGIGHFDGEKWELYAPEDNLPGDCEYIRDIAVGIDGQVWVGFEKATNKCQGGIGRFDGHKWILYINEKGWTSNTIASIAIASDGRVWVGTGHGEISQFDGEKWEPYPTIYEKDYEIAPNHFLVVSGDVSPCLAVGTDGVLWAGISSGVLRFDGKEWFLYQTKDGLVNNNILSVATGSKGDVWFATTNGLSRYAPPNR